MLSLTSPSKTWLHRLPAWLKLGLLCEFTVIVFPLKEPLFLIVALLAVVLLYASCGRDLVFAGLKNLRPLAIFVAFIGIYHLITATYDAGLVVILKLISAVGLANLVTMTTKLSAIVRVIEVIVYPLKYIGVNIKLIGLGIAMAVRFTPVLRMRAASLVEAWKSRSNKKPSWKIVLPLCLLAFDDADNVSEALRARGGVSR